MKQAHSPEYGTREGQIMAAPYRRDAAFCGNIADRPESDIALRPNMDAVNEVATAHGADAVELINRANARLQAIGRPNLAKVTDRNMAIAILKGVTLGGVHAAL